LEADDGVDVVAGEVTGNVADEVVVGAAIVAGKVVTGATVKKELRTQTSRTPTLRSRSENLQMIAVARCERNLLLPLLIM
jgi:hypothetical protein